MSAPDAALLKGWAAERLAAAGVEDARREAVLLLAHAAAGRSRATCGAGASASAWAWSAGARDPVPPPVARRYRRLVVLRAARRPFAQVVGEREFAGLWLRVTPEVLVPRPETEVLLQVALDFLRSWGGAERDAPSGARRRVGRVRLADLGTGSGALALALARAVPEAVVEACDASARALAVARANARRHGLGRRVRFRLGDWWRAFPPRGRSGPGFACAVSNPPYLSFADWEAAPPEVRAEPRAALVAGPTGLEAFEAVAEGAPDHLAPGGLLAFEVGFGQAEAVVRILRSRGFEDVRVHPDLAGVPRVVCGRLGCAGDRPDHGRAPRGTA